MRMGRDVRQMLPERLFGLCRGERSGVCVAAGSAQWPRALGNSERVCVSVRLTCQSWDVRVSQGQTQPRCHRQSLAAGRARALAANNDVGSRCCVLQSGPQATRKPQRRNACGVRSWCKQKSCGATMRATASCDVGSTVRPSRVCRVLTRRSVRVRLGHSDRRSVDCV